MRRAAIIALALGVVPATAAAQPSTVAPVAPELPPLTLPPLDPDTLAYGRTLELVGVGVTASGAGRAQDGEDNESASYELAIASRYFQSLEKKRWAWSVLASGSDSLGRVSRPDQSELLNRLALSGAPEVRFYAPGSLAFFHVTADFSTTVLSRKVTSDFFEGTEDSNAPGQIGIAAGVGYGRVLAIDPTVRLRRLERALIERGTLSGDIPDATGTEIVRTWYALRNDLGLYRTLAYTMKHLDDAHLLIAPPDLRSTYEALQVLEDPFVVDRRHGWEARAGFGIVQPFVGFDDADEADPAFALLASAQQEDPIGTVGQRSLRVKAMVELGGTADDFAGNVEQHPYSLRFYAAFTRAFYAETYEPLGALSVSGEGGVSGLRVEGDDPDLGVDVLGTVAYSRAMQRGSLVTAGVNGALRNDGVYTITLSLGITWGVATGFFTTYAPSAAGI
jgi:hypothetical protein